MIDVTQQISAVRREVGRRVLEAGEARTVTISQTYDAPIDDLWDACTNPERIPRWFLPISGELRLNGRYQLEGNASGTIERCYPPSGFAATWEYGDETSWIELRLTAQSDQPPVVRRCGGSPGRFGLDGLGGRQAIHVSQQ